MGIAEILTAAQSPWQNPYAERMIGTIRRNLLDHVIVLGEEHFRRQLHRYLRYYTVRELTFRWRRTRPNHGRWSHPNSAALSPCLKLVAFTIATLDELLSVSIAREGY